MSPPDLMDLTRVSQSRNGREGITGLMLYDNHRFYQWLEGPPDNVDRLMNSIYADPRHTDVQVLNKGPANSRSFAGWSMKLAAPIESTAAWHRDVIAPPRDLVDDLHRWPEAAPSLLVKLVSVKAHMVEAAPIEAVAQMPLPRKPADILRSVFISAVIPQLTRAKNGLPLQALPPAHERAVELAELLVAANPVSALALIDDLQADGAAIGRLAATLFEPVARSLGDLWAEDLCSEFDVTVALCRLQTAVRLLTAGCHTRLPSLLHQPVVLIAPEPGELHRLGAMLDRSVLEFAGWSPVCEYPTDDAALESLLAESWFDVLDLSLSPAFRREQTLPRLAETIAQARRASRNPQLVVVGGRMFMEERQAGVAVGADAANASSLNVNRAIMRTLTAVHTATPEVTAC